MTEIIANQIDSYVFRWEKGKPKYLLLKRRKKKFYGHLWQGVAGRIEVEHRKVSEHLNKGAIEGIAGLKESLGDKGLLLLLGALGGAAVGVEGSELGLAAGVVISNTDYSKAKAHFDKMWSEFGVARDILFTDFVPAVWRAISRYPAKLRLAFTALFDRWVRETDVGVYERMQWSDETFDALNLKGRVRRGAVRDILSSNVFDDIASGLSAEFSDDVSRTGEELEDITSAEEVSLSFRTDSFNAMNTTFLDLIGDVVSNKDFVETEEKASVLSYEDFKSFVLIKFGKSPTNITEENKYRHQWLRRQPINRVTREESPEFIYTNINPEGEFVNPWVGQKWLTVKKNVDVKSGRNLSRFVVSSFARYDSKKDGIKFGLLRIGDIFTTLHRRIVGEGRSLYFGVNANLTLSPDMLRAWDIVLGNRATPIVIAGVKASTNASIIFAEVSAEHIKQAENYQAYFKKEIELGHLGDEAMRRKLLIQFIISAQELADDGSSRAMAQIIARHEFMKAKRGKTYLTRTDLNVQNHFRRINLDLSEGVVLLGIGSFYIRIFNPIYATLRTKKGKEIPLTAYIAGLEDKYKLDGLMFTSESVMRDTEKYAGRVPIDDANDMDEDKTSIRHLSDDGYDYVAVKAMEMIPEEGIEILDDTGVVIMKVVKQGNLLNMVDSEGNRIDFLISTEEAKDRDGIFKLGERHYTDVIKLPEKARRILIVPPQHSKTSATFPSAWLDVLTAKEFRPVLESLTKHYEWVVQNYVEELFKMRRDPTRIKHFLQSYVEKGLTLPREIDRLVRPNGMWLKDGYLHPHIISFVLYHINNKMLKDGALKGRRIGQGSYLNLKPDMTEEIQSVGDMHVSARNKTTVRLLRKMSGLKSIDEINEWLKDNQVWGLTSRFPINDVPSVAMRRVTKLRKGRHGNSIFFHREDVFGRLQADFDGNNVFLEFFYEQTNVKDLTKKLTWLQASDTFKKKQKVVRLEYFAKSDEDTSYARHSDIYKIGSELIKSGGAQGLVTNIKSVRGVLQVKDFRTVIAGTEIVVVKEDDSVVMDYAPLKDGIKKEDLQGTDTITKDGFLKTTSDYELSTIMQAATDNTKDMLLGLWGYDGRPFLLRKIFKRADGEDLTTNQLNILSTVVNRFIYNKYRRGTSLKGENLNFEGMFDMSREVHEFSRQSKGLQQKDILNSVNAEIKGRTGYGELEKVYVNGKISHLERVLSVLHQVFSQNDLVGYKVAGHPLGFSSNRITNAHLAAVRELPSLHGKWGVTQETLNDVYEIVTPMVQEWRKIFADAVSYSKSMKTNPTAVAYDYNEKLNDFILKWLKKYEQISDEQKRAVTLKFFYGIDELRKKVEGGVVKLYKPEEGKGAGKLLPMELMDEDVYRTYMNLFGKHLKTAGESPVSLKKVNILFERKMMRKVNNC